MLNSWLPSKLQNKYLLLYIRLFLCRWSQHDESQEVARIMAATSIVPACNSSSSEIRRHQATPPNSLWRRQRYSSGSMKTINMNKVGAHNAASALINNQFIGNFFIIYRGRNGQ